MNSSTSDPGAHRAFVAETNSNGDDRAGQFEYDRVSDQAQELDADGRFRYRRRTVVLARCSGRCTHCEAPVEVGQPIVHIRSGWAHHACWDRADQHDTPLDDPGQPRGDQVDLPPQSVLASYPGTCFGCRGPVEVGQEISKVLYGWAHVGHEAAAMKRALPGRSRTAAGYKVECPRCGAEPRKACVSRSGSKAELHTARKRAADE